MRRREAIALLGGTLAVWPLAARGQQARPLIGYLGGRSPQADIRLIAAFRRGLAEAGYIEGRNVAIDFHWAEGQLIRLPDLAAELVRRAPDVIVATGGTRTAVEAKKATATIPIVFIVGGDPVRAKLVDNLARPGGNATGLAIVFDELHDKRFELLRELDPGAGVIGTLVNPANPVAESALAHLQAASQAAGCRLVVAKASNDGELDAAFALFREQRVAALLIGSDSFFGLRHKRIVDLVAPLRIPAIYHLQEFVAAGGLMSYGTSRIEPYRQAGVYAGRILGGARPGDLPVQQPTKFELAINLRTAKALGLSIPTSILVRADEVIE
jgi:putative ABC transport system substrate-binding protein